MPRHLNKSPSYRHHRASGQAIVTIDGKDYYLGPWKSKASQAEYDRIIGEWLAGGRSLCLAAGAAPDDLAIAEVIDRFWMHAETYYRHADGTPTSEVANFRPCLAILNRLHGPTLARDFGPLALQSLRAKMIEKGWCRRVINRATDRVKMVFKWAVAKELIPPSVYQALQTVAGLRMGRCAARESDPVKPVADEVVEATLPFLSRTCAAMVQLQRLTGARPGEICAMRIGDINRTTDVWVYAPASHKTAHHGHGRTIFLGPKAQAVLQPFMFKLDPAAYIFSPIDAERERREALYAARKTPLSCGNRPGSNRKRKPKRTPGECYDVASYRRAIARACELAFPAPIELKAPEKVVELRDWRKRHSWHPHQLRHTAATEIRKRFGIEAAQHVLGRATLSITEIYAEKNSDVARQIAAKIG
jgi:integrase